MAFTASGLRRISDSGLTSSPTLGGSIWHYRSADAHATVEGASYFNNVINFGMAVGDLIFVTNNATGGTTVHMVTAVTLGGYVGQVPTTAAASISPAQLT